MILLITEHTLSHYIQIAVMCLIFIFSCASIALISIVGVMRGRKTRFEKETEVLKAALDNLIVGAAFAATDEELDEIIKKAKPEFAKYIKNAEEAKMMTTELLSIHSNMMGQAKSNLAKLFSEVCLMDFTLRDLESSKWFVKATAIRNLAQINAVKYIPEIEQYATHRNIHLQQEAQIALVNLKGYDGLTFLDKQKNALSDWQQLNILEILRKLDTAKAPDLSQWLSHEENSIKLFSIRLIDFFQQSYNIKKLEEFAEHEDSLLKNEALSVLSKINPGNRYITSDINSA